MARQLLQSASNSLDAANTLLVTNPTEATILTENATRTALVALAIYDGVRIESANKHIAAVRYAGQRPGAFDAITVRALEQLRIIRNAALYGEPQRNCPVPVDVSANDAHAAFKLAQRVIKRVTNVIDRRPIPPPPSTG